MEVADADAAQMMEESVMESMPPILLEPKIDLLASPSLQSLRSGEPVEIVGPSLGEEAEHLFDLRSDQASD